MSQAPHRLRLRLFAELIAWLAIIFRQKTRRRGGQLQCAPDRRARINARDPRRKGVETVNRDPSQEWQRTQGNIAMSAIEYASPASQSRPCRRVFRTSNRRRDSVVKRLRALSLASS